MPIAWLPLDVATATVMSSTFVDSWAEFLGCPFLWAESQISHA